MFPLFALTMLMATKANVATHSGDINTLCVLDIFL